MSSLNTLLSQQEKDSLAKTLAKRHFRDFCVTVDPKYDPQWFHKLLCDKLEGVYRRVLAGESPRLMIFMPPRHGKSETATKKFPAWVLGDSPEFPILVTTYAQDLSTKFGQGTRDLMSQNNYRAIFDTRLRNDTQAKASWMTESGGGYEAVGIGGPITGKGFKIGIIDDPVKNDEEAESEIVQEKNYNWYKTTFYTRQEGNAAIILILTRWCEGDLAGRLLADQEESEKAGEADYDKWEVINFPAIAEEDELYRKKGEALWPGKFNLEKLNRTRRQLGPYKFSALYQQKPIDEESQEIKKDWFRYRTREEVEKLVTRKFATIDTALSRGASSDYTGVTRNWVDIDNRWNLSSMRYRINSAELIDLIFKLHDDGFEKIGVEEGAYLAAVEPFLEMEMRKRNKFPNVVTLKHNQVMKETRIRGLIPRYESGNIFHIYGECDDLESELLVFPKGAHDDCADSVAYQYQLAEPPYPDGDNEDFNLYAGSYT